MGRKVTRLARFIRDVLMGLVILLLAGLIIVKLDEQDVQLVNGPLRAVDGDTLAKGSLRMRLEGIDAPEMEQTCGEPSDVYACGRVVRQRLQSMLDDVPWSCEGRSRDRYGRLLVRCRSGEDDLGRRLVAEGLAIADGDYLGEERAARRAGIGLWQAPFERPADWRRQHQIARGGLEPFWATGSYLSQMVREWLGSE